ncbi:MAG: V-type ATP synthase subunit F [Candidatus Bathyarchaeota archaeon]|nr:MAG: V-type ATP synthase subunit F [Candidatus Bathyarchaeota archaeon]
MPGIALIADRKTATSFKLAGLKDVYHVKNAEEAENHIRRLSEKPGLAIILVEESIVDQIPDVIEKVAERKYPLVVPIPGARGSIAMKTDLIVELIRRKAGIEVKL